MTPLNLILGNEAGAILVLSGIGVLLLAVLAAVLDYLSGTSSVLSPFHFERLRVFLFTTVGLPAAFVLIAAGGTLGAIASGNAETGRGTAALLWLVNVAFVAGVFACGLCSPMSRHWGLGLAGYGAGIGAIIPLLAIISSLGFNDAGLLNAVGDRIAFGLSVGAIMLAVGLCGAAMLAMISYSVERMVLLWQGRHRSRPAAAVQSE